MSTNVGTLDRAIRIAAGIAAITLAFIGPMAEAGTWGWQRIALVAVGTILIATGFVRFCPLYRVFGWRTCPV